MPPTAFLVEPANGATHSQARDLSQVQVGELRAHDDSAGSGNIRADRQYWSVVAFLPLRRSKGSDLGQGWTCVSLMLADANGGGAL